MAFFDFVKTVGQNIFDNLSSASDQNSEKSQKLTKHLKELGIDLKETAIAVEGDKVVVEGRTSAQEMMEKAILALGNIKGVSQVESKIKSPQTMSPRFYTVKSGDTLSKIAKEHYGDANAYMQVFEANKPLLKNPDDIYPGQQLRIPEQKTQAA